jgi:uncharacterized protein (TIGR03435 family)
MRPAAGLFLLCAAGFAQNGFEVASIKPSAQPVGPDYNNHLTVGPSSVSGKNVTLKKLIGEAYGLEPYQISGPGWIAVNEYAVEARGAAPGIREALQALLSERFGLVTHRESKGQRVYELLVDAGGPKLKSSANGTTLREFAELLTVRLTIPVMDDPTRPGTASGERIPVIDRTGLSGRYQILQDVKPEAGGDMFTLWQRVLREQLGLKLEARKTKVEILVVDGATRIPTGN